MSLTWPFNYRLIIFYIIKIVLDLKHAYILLIIANTTGIPHLKGTEFIFAHGLFETFFGHTCFYCYVFLLLWMFRYGYSVSLCSVYCLCVKRVLYCHQVSTQLKFNKYTVSYIMYRVSFEMSPGTYIRVVLLIKRSVKLWLPNVHWKDSKHF
jgi:hypothetical protein